MNQFMIVIDQLYMRKNSALIKERNDYEVLASQLQGKYEGLKDMQESNKAFTEELMRENQRNFGEQIRQVEGSLQHKMLTQSPQIINSGVVNMADIKRTNENFTTLMAGRIL